MADCAGGFIGSCGRLSPESHEATLSPAASVFPRAGGHKKVTAGQSRALIAEGGFGQKGKIEGRKLLTGAVWVSIVTRSTLVTLLSSIVGKATALASGTAVSGSDA